MSSRTMLCTLQLFLVGLLAAPSVYALNVPGVGEKEKKKSGERRRKKEEAKAADQEQAAQEKGETKSTATQPAAGGEGTGEKAEPKAAEGDPAAPGEQVVSSEVTLSQESFDGFKDSKVGAFVEYSMPAQPGVKTRYEVAERTATSLTLVLTTSGPGVASKAITKYVLKEERAKVGVGEKTLECIVTETKSNGQLQSKSYQSKAIPQFMGGLVKTEDAEGKATMVLTDFGMGQ